MTFLPITIFENFTRLSNIFFLAISLIMLIDHSLTPFYHWIMIFPMGFNIFIYMFKEIVLDF